MLDPNFITDDFYKNVFAGCPLLLASHPYNHPEIASWNRSGSKILNLEGSELLCIAVIAGAT